MFVGRVCRSWVKQTLGHVRYVEDEEGRSEKRTEPKSDLCFIHILDTKGRKLFDLITNSKGCQLSWQIHSGHTVGMGSVV